MSINFLLCMDGLFGKATYLCFALKHLQHLYFVFALKFTFYSDSKNKQVLCVFVVVFIASHRKFTFIRSC